MKHRETDAQLSRLRSCRHGQQGSCCVRARQAIPGCTALLAVARGVGRRPVRMGMCPPPPPPPPRLYLASDSKADFSSHNRLNTCKVTNTGQLNTILTFYEISDPPVPSALSGIPESLLRSAIAVLAKSGRAQLISISDGDGVRFFPPRSAK